MKLKLLIFVFIVFTFSCKKENENEIVQIEKKDYNKGKELFQKNCASCHSIKMNLKATAPALGGVTKRREKEWLYQHTRNSIKMHDNGDSISIELRKSNGYLLMPSFEKLNEKNLDDIYFFIEEKYKKDTLVAVKIK